VSEPVRGWRAVRVGAQRPRLDFAHCLQAVAAVHAPDAEPIVRVLDHLNTPSPAALAAAFPPAAARRLTEKLEIHHTPTHGSWLTMAELELSVLGRQCLAQRRADRDAMEQAGAAWTTRRNATAATIRWHFTTADARTTLRRLYPAFEP